MTKKAVSLSSFVLRHFIASMVSIVAPIVILIIGYFVLVVIAIFSNSGVGSPIALPFWTVFVFVTSILYTAILIFPSVLIAETISHIFGKWQHIAQIPISTLTLAMLIYATVFIVRHYPNYPEIVSLHWADHPFILFLILAIPLGIYWWTMKIAQAGISFPFIFFNRLRKVRGSKTP
jgi:hypothetical protein